MPLSLSQQAQKRRERYQWLATYKVQRGCDRCGYNEFAAALQFHHREPDQKRKNLGAMLRYSMDSILAEIDKCDVLCANCHAVETWSE